MSFASLLVTNIDGKLRLINEVQRSDRINMWKLCAVELISILLLVCTENKEIQGQEMESKMLCGRMNGPNLRNI